MGLSDAQRRWLEGMDAPVFNQAGQTVQTINRTEGQPTQHVKINLFSQKYNLRIVSMTKMTDRSVMVLFEKNSTAEDTYEKLRQIDP